MSKIFVPPIKSQGIKTKLVPWIKNIIPREFTGVWIEPFTGTGVVAFNLAPKNAILADSNPYIISFYGELLSGRITPDIVRNFLQEEGRLLIEKGEEHYYYIRERFNKDHDPLDFLFLNRSCFNGMIRFNKKGGFNVPFCRKPERFSKSYITKIVNQVSYVYQLLQTKNYTFLCQDFQATIALGTNEDFIYCDPPYIGRHVEYFNGWDEKKEIMLNQLLGKTESKFILSTWHSNDFRENDYLKTIWSAYYILTREHFYHVGGKEKNRNAMLEALVTNYPAMFTIDEHKKPVQLTLCEEQKSYQQIAQQCN
jgi:DNA adenine methylase